MSDERDYKSETYSSMRMKAPVPASHMTLRDWYAGQVLAGLLASPNDSAPFSTFEEVARHYSETAYLYADAMLVARKGGES